MGHISMTMALDSLREASEDVRASRQRYEHALATRDDLIRDMRSEGISHKRIAEVTGLSRDSLHRICNSARPGVSQP